MYKRVGVWYPKAVKNVFVKGGGEEMAGKKWLSAVMRLLCGLIDYLILMFPVQLVMLFGMQIPVTSVDFLFRLLFAVYGVLMVEYNHGATLGKMLGRMVVVDKAGGPAPILYVGLRELVKSMYLIPVIGWAFGLVSAVMMFWRGTTLHDMVGNTRVLFRWQVQPPEKDPEEKR